MRGNSEASVAYSQHQSVDTDALSIKLFNRTNTFIARHGSSSNFAPVTIAVITWRNGSPYPYWNYVGKNQVSINAVLLSIFVAALTL